MDRQVCYEDYPLRFVICSNLLSLLIYIIGIFLISRIGIIWAALYILFIFVLEIRLLGRHCVDCYYFGKTCAFGKGRLSSFIFKKGDQKRFSRKIIAKKDMIPDLLVIIIPVLASIFHLIFEFQWFIAVLIIILVILGSSGNAFVRGNLACRYCKQKETGCPAFQLFEKKER